MRLRCVSAVCCWSRRLPAGFSPRSVHSGLFRSGYLRKPGWTGEPVFSGPGDLLQSFLIFSYLLFYQVWSAKAGLLKEEPDRCLHGINSSRNPEALFITTYTMPSSGSGSVRSFSAGNGPLSRTCRFHHIVPPPAYCSSYRLYRLYRMSRITPSRTTRLLSSGSR